jgi:hypothetical protein
MGELKTNLIGPELWAEEVRRGHAIGEARREEARRRRAAAEAVSDLTRVRGMAYTSAPATSATGGGSTPPSPARDIWIDGDRPYLGHELIAERNVPTLSRREAGDVLARYALRELRLSPGIEMREAFRRARAALPAARDVWDAPIERKEPNR